MRKNLLQTVIATTLLTAAATQAVADDHRPYAVVVSKKTATRADWKAVVDALVTKHRAEVVTFDGDVSQASDPLRKLQPDYVCFVLRPQEAGRKAVVAIHRLTRQLDDDPYTDAIWGILTGYEAADALRIAKRTEPLIVRRGATSMGPGMLDAMDSGFASAETDPKHFYVKQTGGKVVKQAVQDGPAASLARGFNTMKPQMFFTSGHATEHDWQIGYNVRAGQFRHQGGRLHAVNTAGKKFPIDSPEPKVYLPGGNCLIGHIDRPDCMATAWMHSAGVYQMYGYTAVTFDGTMGWGTAHRFQSGQHTLAEAFFWTSQDLLWTLQRTYPRKANVDFENYDHRAINAMIRTHRLVTKNQTGQVTVDRKLLGLLWDRDCVAFYGDPAWEARLPKREQPWKAAFKRRDDGTWQLTVTAEKDGAGPGRLNLLLPKRLANPTVLDAADHAVLLTNSFIMIRFKGGSKHFKAAQPVRITFKSLPTPPTGPGS